MSTSPNIKKFGFVGFWVWGFWVFGFVGFWGGNGTLYRKKNKL